VDKRPWTHADDAYLVARPHATAAQLGTELGRTTNAIRKRRAVLAAPFAPPPPKRRGKPQNQCHCGKLKTAWARQCRACAARALNKPDALAEALRRDERPDEEKLPARLTLLKALWRQAQRKAA
jgi:hypothetical protein